MSIGQAIDAVVRCTICNAPPGCRCWVTIQCPRCLKTLRTERLECDGDEDVIDARCPDCDGVEGAIE